jgi:hypothetical protein
MNPFDFDVSLRIFSYKVLPADICRRLKMAPKWLQQIGCPRTTPEGRLLGGVYDRNYCSFPIQRCCEDEVLETLLERVSITLMEHKELFIEIRKDKGRSEFFVGWYASSNNGCVFNTALLKKLTELEIDISLDVYGN